MSQAMNKSHSNEATQIDDGTSVNQNCAPTKYLGVKKVTLGSINGNGNPVKRK